MLKMVLESDMLKNQLRAHGAHALDVEIVGICGR
jgi:hypothetical protein